MGIYICDFYDRQLFYLAVVCFLKFNSSKTYTVIEFGAVLIAHEFVAALTIPHYTSI